MPVIAVNIWEAFNINPEDLPEDLGIAEEDAPAIALDEQIVPGLNAEANLEESTVRTGMSQCVESGKTGDHNSSSETLVSSSTDNDQVEDKNEHFKSLASYSKSEAERLSDISWNGNGGIRRRPRTLTDENHSSSAGQDVCAVKKEFNMKIFLFDMIATIGGLVVPILAIAFGAGSVGKCPTDFSLPYLVFFMGVLGLLIVSYALLKTNEENFDGLDENDRTAIALATWLLFVLWMWEVGQFFSVPVSFDSSAENYCIHTFYTFVIFMDVFYLLGFIVGICLLGEDAEKTSLPMPDGLAWLAFEDF